VREGNIGLICVYIGRFVTGKKAEDKELKAKDAASAGEGKTAKLAQNHEFLRIILTLPFFEAQK
jgi:hypothetical protein